MRLVRVSKSLVGKSVALPVYAADGRVLLNAGTILSEAYIDGLRRWGFARIAIEDPLLKGVKLSDPISSVTRAKATGAVRMALLEASKHNTFDVSQPSDAVEGILQDIQASKNVVHSISAMRSFDDYTYVHSVNVCVLCILMGQVLQYNRVHLRKLAIGALLHDLGKIHVPTSILNKPGKLSDQEFSIVRTHALRGFEMLCSKTSLVSAHVAFQHHERHNGSGYPRGLKGDEIHDFGRVAAVADVYDALTSDRPYRKAMTPGQALTVLESPSTGIDSEVVGILKSKIALYSEGTVLQLADGRIALVIAQSHDSVRPDIRVISTREGKYTEPYDLRLVEHEDLIIKQVMSNYPEELAGTQANI